MTTLSKLLPLMPGACSGQAPHSAAPAPAAPFGAAFTPAELKSVASYVQAEALQ